MTKLFKIDQLVYASINVYDGMGHSINSGFGVITSIIDNLTGEKFYEKECITGCGDRNTKVTINVDIISIDPEFRDISSPRFTEIKDVIKVSLDPHNVYSYSIEEAERDYNKKLEHMSKKIEFIRNYSLTRDDKINIILESNKL